MSLSLVVPFKCPDCGKESSFTVWQSINTQLDPHLKQELLSGEMLKFTCSACQSVQDVAYSLLYHDQENKKMIWWIPPNQDGSMDLDEKALVSYAQTMTGYTLRLVATMNQLREKIYIFDAGLDDRAVELLKHYLWSAYLEEEGVHEEHVFFAAVTDAGEEPELEFDYFHPDGEQNAMQVGGKNGYPMALDILYNQLKVPQHEETLWKIVDYNYWEQFEQSNE